MTDPYRDLLGLPDGPRPPTHYQLLGVPPGDQEPTALEWAALRQTLRLKPHDQGPRAADCARLRAEIGRAHRLLRDPTLRRAYDAHLADPAGVPAPEPPGAPADPPLMAAAPPPAAEAEPPLLSSEPALLIAPAAPPLLEPPPLLAVPPPTPPDPPPLVAVTPAAEPRPTPRAAPLPRSKRQPLANPATPARAPLPAAAQRAPQDKGAKPPGGPPQLKTDAERLKPTWKVYAGIVFVPTAAIGLFFLGKLLFGATPARSEAAPVVIGQDKAAPRPKPTTSPPRPAGQLPATKPAARYQPLDLERAATAFGAKLRFGDQLAEGLPLPKGAKPVEGVPFDLVDPQNGEVKNVIVLHSKGAAETRELPQRVIVPCEATVKALHLLGGVAGWGHPASPAGSVSLKVRFVGKDGLLEEHALKNGAHLANVAGADDVPESRPALKGEGWQVRYLAIPLGKPGFVRNIELVKGEDGTAPIIVALTVERPNN